MNTQRDLQLTIEPRLSAAQREEVGHLEYFLEELASLGERGLISPGLHRTLAQEYGTRRQRIEQQARAEAALARAASLADRPGEALRWAETARVLDPDRQEAWLLVLRLRLGLHQYREVEAQCAEAAGRFPALRDSLDLLLREAHEREAAWQREQAWRREEQQVVDMTTRARSLLAAEHNHEALEACMAALQIRPDDRVALSLKAQAHARLGQLEEAIAVYHRLQELQPAVGAWPQAVMGLRLRQARDQSAAADGTEVVSSRQGASCGSPGSPAAPDRAADTVSGSTIAGEFLKEHWQKLTLCLAVLLILVSSTAGAHHVLGPLLWQPEGKCGLALVYTLMLAGFGCGLVRWGAEAAGRVVLLTTLSVVPINFALAGELRMLAEPSALRLLVLALVTITLLGISSVIPRVLAPRSSRLVPAAFFTLSAANAVVSPGLSLFWGWVALLAPGLPYLGALFRENRRQDGGSWPEGDDTPRFALGLLTYAYLFGVLHTGLFVLDLIPTLYALPAMLIGVAGVDTAAHDRGANEGDEAPRAGVLLLIGQLMVGVAFALALARPPDPSPLFSGNTLATALLGLALFATCLCATRQPLYLYLAFAALFLAYFGAGYFIADMTAAIEETARRALGYEERLPVPFKALNGIVFNGLLAALALLFSRRWQAPRLERHCHIIGLPVAIAACLLSLFEPGAAVLCLSAYTLLFGVGAGLFVRPLLVALATVASGGACFFALTFFPGLTPGAWALGAAVVGGGDSCIHRFLRSRRVPEPYRLPLLHAALFASAVALGTAAFSLLGPVPERVVPLTLLTLAGLYCLVHVERAWSTLPWLAVGSLTAAFSAAAWRGLAELHCQPLPAALAVALGGGALLLCVAAEGASRRRRRWIEGTQPACGIDAPTQHFSLSAYVMPMRQIGLAVVAVTWLLSAAAPHSSLLVGTALALTTICLALATREYTRPAVAHLSMANALASCLCLFHAALRGSTVGATVYGLTVILFALALLATAAWVRRRAERRHEARADAVAGVWLSVLPDFSLVAILSALVLGATDLQSRVGVSAALLLAALGFLWLTRFRRQALLVYLSLVSAVTAALPLVTWGADGERPGLLLASLALTAAIAALSLWGGGALCRRRGDDFTSTPSFEVARVLTVASTLPAVMAVLAIPPALLTAAGALLLAALAFLLLTSVWKKAWLTHAAVIAFAGSAHVLLLSTALPGRADVGTHGLLAAALAVVCWRAASLGQRHPVAEWSRVYWQPLFRTSLGLALLAVPLSLVPSGTAWFGAATLLLAALAFLLLTGVWREAALTYAAAAAGVMAAHRALLASYPPGIVEVGAHGFLTAILALALWLIAFLGRRHTAEEQHDLYWRPLFTASIALTLLAAPLSVAAPPALLLIAIGFLMAVSSFPGAGWLYGVLGSLAWAARLIALPDALDASWVKASVAAALGLWGIGILLQTRKATLCRRLELPELGYEYPLFNAAWAAGSLALLLRLGGSLFEGEAWTAHLLLWPVLALLSLLMLRPYPGRGWVHASVTLLTLALVLRVEPHVVSPGWWLPLGLALALLWQSVCRIIEPVETRLCDCLGIRQDQYSQVPGAWALVLFAVGALLAAGLVAAGVIAAVWGASPAVPVTASGWWAVLVALPLATGYLFLNRSCLPAEGWPMAPVGTGLLLLWWVGAPGSPAVGIAQGIPGYYPLTTVLFSLFTAAIGARWSRSLSGNAEPGAGVQSDSHRSRLATCAHSASLALVAVALLMTRGEATVTTALTFALATGTAAAVAAVSRWVPLAYAAAGLFVATCLYAAMVLVAPVSAGTGPEPWIAVAIGLIAGASLLLAVAGRLRVHSAESQPVAVTAGRQPSERALVR